MKSIKISNELYRKLDKIALREGYYTREYIKDVLWAEISDKEWERQND